MAGDDLEQERRITRLEANMENIKQTVLEIKGMLTVMADKMFSRAEIESRFQATDDRLSQCEADIKELKGKGSPIPAWVNGLFGLIGTLVGVILTLIFKRG